MASKWNLQCLWPSMDVNHDDRSAPDLSVFADAQALRVRTTRTTLTRQSSGVFSTCWWRLFGILPMGFVLHRELEALGLGQADLGGIAAEDLARYASGWLRVEKRGEVFGTFVGGHFEASFVLPDFFWDRFLGEKFPNGCVVALPANDMLSFCDPASLEGVAELKHVVARTFDGGEDLLTPFLDQRCNGKLHAYADFVREGND